MADTALPHLKPEKGTSWKWRVWRRWVLANALGETIGLGGTLLIGVLLFSQGEKVLGAIATAGLAVLAGTFIEGTVVGTAQWLVLQSSMKGIRWREWVAATALGAGIAWTLGMIPSTLMFTGADTGASAPAEISDALIYALAAGMGFVLGPILGIPQWWVLRRFVYKAGWWVLANALAWACGMVIVFVGINFIPQGAMTLSVAMILLAALAAAGAVVGAVHGSVLVWLLQAQRSISR